MNYDLNGSQDMLIKRNFKGGRNKFINNEGFNEPK